MGRESTTLTARKQPISVTLPRTTRMSRNPMSRAWSKPYSALAARRRSIGTLAWGTGSSSPTAPRHTTRRRRAWRGSEPSPSCGVPPRCESIMLTIDIDTARRFILGKQGLWPGRRWRGIKGAAQAMRAIEYLQLDPLQIIARSHDITLHSRVLDYTPGMWEELAYGQRQFFDWGGWLAVRPMDELPHWRVVMHRERDGDYGDSRLRQIARDHAATIAEMRVLLHERGTVTNRDFA